MGPIVEVVALAHFVNANRSIICLVLSAPMFELTTATAPDWGELWRRLRGYVLVAAMLVAWITFWAFDSRARLQATHSPQPAPLPDDSHAARVGVSEAELAAWRLAKVQTVDIDPTGHVIMRVDGGVR